MDHITEIEGKFISAICFAGSISIKMEAYGDISNTAVMTTSLDVIRFDGSSITNCDMIDIIGFTITEAIFHKNLEMILSNNIKITLMSGETESWNIYFGESFVDGGGIVCGPDGVLSKWRQREKG